MFQICSMTSQLKIGLVFGIVAAVVMIVLRWVKFNFWMGDLAGEWIIVIFSGVAFGLGLLVTSTKKKNKEENSTSIIKEEVVLKNPGEFRH